MNNEGSECCCFESAGYRCPKGNNKIFALSLNSDFLSPHSLRRTRLILKRLEEDVHLTPCLVLGSDPGTHECLAFQ
jgi:hypothetical protein